MQCMEQRARRASVVPAALVAVLAGSGVDPAFADLTLFAGRAATPAADGAAPGLTGGAALGMSLRRTGLEFEYARMSADRDGRRPALQTGLFNVIVDTPFRSGRRLRVYGSVGGGLYRERNGERTRTNLAVGGGGGVYLHLAGPFRLRVDYRFFLLRGEAGHRRPRRSYAGLDLGF